jgi:dihydrolipoamide dehydrogenase
MPSKTLLRPGDVVWEAEHAVGTSRPLLDWPAVARYRNYMVNDWNDDRAVQRFVDAGIEFIRGSARITGEGSVEVDGSTLRYGDLVVATGSKASIPPIEGLPDAGYWTNREGTELQEIPGSVLVLGGGAVGCELGQMLNSFGSRVTIVEGMDHLLGRENPKAASYLQRRFEERGITVKLGRKVTRVTGGESGRTAALDDGSEISSDVVLVATGRAPCVDGLGLETIGVHPTRRGIPIDEHCRAGEHVWAVGDVTGVAGFTHVADYQAQIAAASILGHPRPANYSAIPAVTFVDPEVASVGITDPSHAPAGMDIVTAHVDLLEGARTETYGKGLEGGMELLAERGKGVLVGAWAVGPLAGEWIQFASLAIRAQVPIHVLTDTMLAFPTFTRLYLQPFRDLQKELG